MRLERRKGKHLCSVLWRWEEGDRFPLSDREEGEEEIPPSYSTAALSAAALNAWGDPLPILYLNSACLPAGLFITLLTMMVMTVPAALVVAPVTTGAGPALGVVV